MRSDAREGPKEFKAKMFSLPAIRPDHLRLVLIGLLGIALLWLGSSLTPSQKPEKADTQVLWDLEEYQARIAREVENVISSVKGVGKVKVKVTLEEGPAVSYVTNETRTTNRSTETSQDGGKRETVSESETSQPVTGQGLGGQNGLVAQTVRAPVISGCVVVAEGASSADIRASIYSAVSVLLNLPIYKIMVLPMEGGH